MTLCLFGPIMYRKRFNNGGLVQAVPFLPDNRSAAMLKTLFAGRRLSILELLQTKKPSRQGWLQAVDSPGNVRKQERIAFEIQFPAPVMRHR